MKLTVSLLQMEQKQKDYEANLRAVRDFFRTLPEKTDIAVLPEMWTTGFMTTKEELDRELIEEAFQKGREAMKALASEYGTAVYGSLIEPLANGKLSNSAFFVDESGKEIGYYPKHQLFGPGGEKKYFSAGDRRVQIAYKDFQIRLAVCYDLRFPIWLRQDRSLGLYDLLLFCANWPEPRQEHWQTLLKARAIENQAFVAATNRVGKGPADLHYPGLSAVYDAWGTSIAVGDPARAGWLTATLSADELATTRKSFPVLDTLDSFSL